jgi:hypothetical protein
VGVQRHGAIVLLALALPLLGGCVVEEPSPDGGSSGFLSNTSQLQPGRGDQAQLIYINPETDFSSYENVIVDPVAVWQGAGSRFAGVSDQDLTSLAQYLGESMRRELAHEFELLDRPAPGTLRVRIGLVEVSGAGKGADIEGSVAIELEILDAVSGERLVAAADSRGEGGEPDGTERAGTNLHNAFDEWAGRARDRLSLFRDFDAAQAAQGGGP